VKIRRRLTHALFPHFGPNPPEDLTDFNDMASLVGIDATRTYLLAALNGAPPPVAPPSGGGGKPPSAPPPGGSGGGNSKDGPTEDCVARGFARARENDLRYDHSRRRWYRFNGHLWVPDQVGTVQELLKAYVRSLGVRDMLTHRALSSIASLVRTDALIAVTGSSWDFDPFLLGTPNGVMDLRTGAYVPDPEQRYVTKTTSVAPSSGNPTLWSAFLHEATAGDAETIEFLRLWFGYCLTGDVSEQILVFIYGDGGSGKGVFVNTMLRLIGSYGYAAPINMFAASRQEQHPTSMADLMGRRFVVASETKRGARWADEQVKWLTGGDRITARRMRGDFFSYDPTHKITIVGNHAPALDATDNAMKRRLRVVPFDHKPVRQDSQLADKLAAEAPQILNWVIGGCVEWQRVGLSNPPKIRAATDAYFVVQDLFGDWCRACCDITPDAVEPTKHLLASWNSFRRDHGEPPEIEKSLVERLQRAGFTAGGDTRAYCEDGRCRVGKGLKLRVTSSAAPMLF
jgi:putative DNA primase/helicase